MTDHGREFEPEQEDAGDPAQAFDALRRTVEKSARELGHEMGVIRKGVEAAFEEFEKFQQPPDYGPDLMRLMKNFGNLAQRFQAVEKSPALKNGPDHYARVLENAGDRLSENASRMLEQRERGLERIRADLAESIRSARARQEQNMWLWGAGAAGLVVGILLTLFLPRVLPGSVDMAVASTVMSADRWNAGVSLMQSGSPGGWRSIVEASDLVRDNRAALTACAEAAAKAKTDQSCTINVSVPAQP